MNVNDDFLSLIPEGWLRKYMDLMVEANNEMPLPFHFLTMATVLGHMIGLGAWCYINKGVEVYPHMNTMLLSPSGRCRRGAGTKLGMKVAKLAGVNVFTGGKITPEGLLDELMDEDNVSGKGNVLLYVEELSVMFTKREYQRAMIPLLTKALLHGDETFEERTRTGGRKVVIERINLSMVATTAPEWFLEAMPEEAFGGGLMSRIVPCHLKDREVFWIDPAPEDAAGMDRSLAELATELQICASMLKGQVEVDKKGVEWLKKAYDENEKRELVDARMEPHRNRAPSHWMRMAMVLAASCGESWVSKDRLEQAKGVLDWLEPTVMDMFGVTDQYASDVGKAETAVVQYLKGRGEALHKDVMRVVRRHLPHQRDRRACLEGMVEQGYVERVSRPGYPQTWWPPLGWRKSG